MYTLIPLKGKDGKRSTAEYQFVRSTLRNSTLGLLLVTASYVVLSRFSTFRGKAVAHVSG